MITPQTYKQRRIELVHQVNGPVFLIAGFETPHHRFHQESTFFYYTGINEPGCFCLIEQDGTTTIFVPQYATNRAQWIPGSLEATEAAAQQYGVERIIYAGSPCKGYTMPAYFDAASIEQVRSTLQNYITKQSSVFAMLPSLALDHISAMVPGLSLILQSANAVVGRMRRIKSQEEIEALYNAIDVTMLGQEAAARAIQPGNNECQVAAAVDYIFAESLAMKAFPSIVGSGPNATVLHYNDNCREMRKGECVIVDVGACLNQYCGDLTRTYPVSGKFSKRQKEVYNAVLATQHYLAAVVKPGFWLRNDEEKEKSLYHLMEQSLREKGLEKYIAHGVGHFLGLDVHDVGDVKEPLQVGDVITIEPGIYIPEEQFGVRIEDNYWIVQDGAVCLSEALPSSAEAVEELVQRKF